MLVRQYVLRDAAAAARGLGAGAVVAGWINRAIALLRDESDRRQAVRLLRLAAALLAPAVRDSESCDGVDGDVPSSDKADDGA